MTENNDAEPPIDDAAAQMADNAMRTIEETALTNVLALLAAPDDEQMSNLATAVAQSYARGDAHAGWAIFVSLRTLARMYRHQMGRPMSVDEVAEALRTTTIELLDPERYDFPEGDTK